MAQRNSVSALGLTSVDGTAITIGTWTAFDADGIEGSCFYIRINNDSDADVFISFDGATRHEFVAAGDKLDLSFQSNSAPSGYVSILKKWTKLYVQGNAAQAGEIYLSGYYNSDF